MREDGIWETFVGIDVPRIGLMCICGREGESFALAREGEALAGLVERLRALAPSLTGKLAEDRPA